MWLWLGLQVNADTPTETECRPHIEKALNTLKADNKGNWNDLNCGNWFIYELISISIGNLEPDSAEVVVEVDDSKEADVADVDSDDDDSDEAKNDLNTDEGIKLYDFKRIFPTRFFTHFQRILILVFTCNFLNIYDKLNARKIFVVIQLSLGKNLFLEMEYFRMWMWICVQ